MAETDYGSLVIGEEAYQEAVQREEAAVDIYGPLVTGEQVDDSPEAAQLREEADAAGKAELQALADAKRAENAAGQGNPAVDAPGTHHPPPPPHPDLPGFDEIMERHGGEEGYLAVEDVKSVLGEMPSAFDRLLGWELSRADGPRITALTHFLSIEVAREHGPRSTVHAVLEEALTAARDK